MIVSHRGRFPRQSFEVYGGKHSQASFRRQDLKAVPAIWAARSKDILPQNSSAEISAAEDFALCGGAEQVPWE